MYRAKKMLKHWNVQIQKGSNSENPAFVMNVKAHPVLGQSRMCTSREAISYIPSATQTPPTAQLRAIVECPTDEGDGDQPGAETDTETDGMRPETLAAPNPTSTSVSKLPSSGNLKPACPRDTILSTTQILEVIQRAIQLHENNELTKAFHLYCLTALQGSSMGLFLSGLALRHGWGCVVDQELALACFEYAVHNSIKTIHLFESSRRSSTCRPGGVDIEAILDRHRRTSKNASVDATLPRMVKGIMQQEATLGVKTTQERTNGSNAFLSVDGNQAQAASQSTLAQMARFELAMSVYELGQCYFHGWGVTKSKSTAGREI
jgi:TPR repeat protein